VLWWIHSPLENQKREAFSGKPECCFETTLPGFLWYFQGDVSGMNVNSFGEHNEINSCCLVFKGIFLRCFGVEMISNHFFTNKSSWMKTLLS